MVHIYIAIGLAAIGAIVGYFGYAKARKTDMYGLYVEATKVTELAAGVPGFYGGTVAALQGQPALVAPYSKQPCVWYDFTLEQEEMTRDANGNATPEWRTISQSGPQGVLFTLQGSGGAVCVNPTNAQVDKVQQYTGLVQATDGPASGALGAMVNVMNALSNYKVRVTEYYVPLGQQLYVGGVSTTQNGLQLFASDQSYPLVLTTQSKADLVKSGHKTTAIEYGIAAALFVGAIVVAVALKK